MWSVWQTWKMGRRAAGFLGGLLVALLLAAGPAAGATFSDPMTLSNGGEAITPAVAVTSSGQVYVAWKEGNNIWFNRSVQSQGSCAGPGGLEFPKDRAQNLSNYTATQARAESPSIAANDAGGVFVVWRELRLDGTGVPSVQLWRSLPGGLTSLESLHFNQGNPGFPAVAADNNHGVFVAAEAAAVVNSQTRTSVVVARSLDDGASSSFTYANLTADRPVSRRPSMTMASDGSKVHVVWRGATAASAGPLTGVWYKGFAPASDLTTVGKANATPLTAAGVDRPPKIAVQVSEVTAAWFEGGNLQASTMTDGANFGPAKTIYPSTMSVSNLSLSFGGAGRFVAWHEDSGSTISLRYLLGTESPQPQTLPSGISSEGTPSTPTAGPSVGQDGTGRLVVTWRENGTPNPEIKLAYTGGSGGGSSMLARVWADPRVLNYRTVGRGTGEQGNYTVYIELLDPRDPTRKDAARTIDPGSVRLKVQGKDPGYAPLLSPSALGDHDGNGIMDLMVKFNRSIFSIFDGAGTVVAAQSTGTYNVSYTVNGETSGSSKGCFKSDDAVQIVR